MNNNQKIKILIFTEGTILMHKNAKGKSRKKIMNQVQENEQSVHDYPSYIPIGKAAEKITEWKNQGAEIMYLTSRTRQGEISDIQKVLDKFHFPIAPLYFRKTHEEYKDVAERILPDILIEDDCESIGGIDEMTITHVDPKIRGKIHSIAIKEFFGIDHLPDKLVNLQK